MIDGQNVFDPPVRNNLITYDSICNIAIVQGDDYTNGCLLDCNYFKKYYEMIAIDVSEQQASVSKPIPKINFTGNLNWVEGTTMFFTTVKAKENISEFL